MSYDEHLISMAGGDGDVLDQIQRRADKATPGPWHAGRGATSDGTEFVRTHEQKAAFLALSLNEGESDLWLVDNNEVIPAATGDGPKAKANAEFIAHARTDVPALLALVRERDAAIARVLALAASWESSGEQDIAYSKAIPDAEASMSLLTHGADMVENARHIRAALEPTP